jgi:adenylate cyclase
MNIEATERAHEIVKVDRQTLGFEPEIWLAALRGRTLVMMGRREEAQPILDRILQLEPDQVKPIDHIMPSMAYVDVAWAEGNVALAREHADRAFVIATRSANPYIRVYAQACRGLSHIVAGQLGAAIEDLSEALRFARSRKAGLENEPRILADLANVYRLNGDTQIALSTVIEAIRVATERHARVPECLARIVCGKLFLQSTNDSERAEGSRELDRARALMHETGAILFEPFIEGNVPQDGNRSMSISAT